MSGDIEVMNSLFERLGSDHRIVPGTLIGADIAKLFSLVLDRIEKLELHKQATDYGPNPDYDQALDLGLCVYCGKQLDSIRLSYHICQTCAEKT